MEEQRKMKPLQKKRLWKDIEREIGYRIYTGK